MDLRAPLPASHCPACPFSSPLRSSYHQYYKKLTRGLLCRIYIASNVMELGSESRFTSLILFHRYVRHFHVLVIASRASSASASPSSSLRDGENVSASSSHVSTLQETQHNNEERTESERKKIHYHLGKVAAACLFLGCKMEEEPRRIRDVINVSHVLQFSSWETWEDDGDGSNDFFCNDRSSRLGGGDNSKTSTAVAASRPANGIQTTTEISPEITITTVATAESAAAAQKATTTTTTKAHATNTTKSTTQIKPLNIQETKHPPPLDDSYWTAKENTVSIEQQVLRMLQFDTLERHCNIR
ncbi:hypothetical protein ACHAXS_005306 [Conticribra weissflogii]